MTWQSLIAATTLTLTISQSLIAQQFPGWQGMRVIEQEGRPSRVRIADLNNDGRDEIILINKRHSRLDIYHRLTPDQRPDSHEPDPDRPNELPMAPDFERTEIVLDRLPIDLMVCDLDQDNQKELLIVESQPLRLTHYKPAEDGDFEEHQHWDLLPGELDGYDHLLRWSPIQSDTPTVLLSFKTGWQTVELTEEARATWLSPRERSGRVDWWLADLDRDTDQDIIEWTRRGDHAIRWYENTGNALLPARGLTDDRVDDVQLLTGDDPQLFMLGGTVDGLLRRQSLQPGEPGPLGKHEPLPLPEGDNTHWSGIEIDGQPAIVITDPAQPRLLLYRKVAGGWSAAESYPSIGDIKSIVAPPGQPGTLFMLTKDAADLHVSQWRDGRMSYPRPMHNKDQIKPDSNVLALGYTGDTTWAIRKHKNLDLDLLLWPADQSEPIIFSYPKQAGVADKAVWLGDTNLLVLDQYKRDPRHLRINKDGKTLSSKPAHLSKAELTSFTMIRDGDTLRPARYVDGVLQWLDEDLQPTDQVMLPDELKLTRYIPNPNGSAWAMDATGNRLHLLKPDAAGVMRLSKSHDIPTGQSIVDDPVVGLVLQAGSQLIKLSHGRPLELTTIETIDSRSGRPSGVREATIHRLLTTDIDGDGTADLILTDDKRHQITVHRFTGDKLEPMISWPVFEDSKYPYGGGGGGEQISEPNRVIAANLDGDDAPDLVMLCQNRLLIYLGRENNQP